MQEKNGTIYMHTDEGYLIIQMGPQKYFEMSLNAALSVRYNDPKREVCLVTDNVDRARNFSEFFQHIKELEILPNHYGTSYKLLAPRYTPFKRTIILDADVLVVKRDSDFWWKFLRSYPVGITGKFLGESTRYYKRWDITPIKKLVGINNYIAGYNGGAIYFDDSDMSRKVFLKALEIFDNHNEAMVEIIRGDKGSRHSTNEDLLLSLALVYFNQKPVPMVFKRLGRIKQWMQCITGSKVSINIKKGRCRSRFDDGRKDSPTIAHFPGLIHKDIYFEQANWLRRHYGLPVFEPF